MEKHLIEYAYDSAKKEYGDKHFTFKDIYNSLLKKGIDVKNSVGELYTEMIQDFRFISLGKEKWALRENFTMVQIEKILSSMFGLDEYHEEDANKYMSKKEKEELNSKEKDDILPILENDETDDLDISNLTGQSEFIDSKIDDDVEEDDDSDDENISIDDDESAEEIN
ncbi:MAG: DNA-directed RNA polymerase subunit delta [Malacoplasma sp.]